MILEHLSYLRGKRIVLASSSPRRKEILEKLGLNFEILVSNFEENLDKSLFSTPADYVTETARQKALAVVKLLSAEEDGASIPSDLVIGADTVVVLDNQILEKPADEDHAVRMLSSLSGKVHRVFTGVTLISLSKCGVRRDQPLIHTFTEKTEVHFDSLSASEIQAYVATGEPMDKAGGYGCQSAGGAFISKLDGCFFNVMGFPLHAFCSRLKQLVQEGEL